MKGFFLIDVLIYSSQPIIDILKETDPVTSHPVINLRALFFSFLTYFLPKNMFA